VKITITEWAERTYSKPPSRWVLLKWIREGQIYPPPERASRDWFVEPEARRMIEGAKPSLVRRIA
jgi:hypothetical protein